MQTVESLFDEAIARYKSGEAVQTLISTFQEICDRAPKSSPAWTCLAWLYLLDDKPQSAYQAAQKAVKLNPEDPQARVNLAIAMLETGKKGVRSHIELVQHIVMAIAELREEVQQNLADGLERKPNWQSLKRVQSWLFEG
uniref:TPR repeat-containing protein n=1 Tax=Cyanothece sp. (strain PCC 7425 / ATCC 29141) TaxID=395961 RepID=B8HL18_CYAP4